MPPRLQPEVIERLQRILKEDILPRFGPDPDRQQSAAARAIGIKASSINRLLNHGMGGSKEMLDKVEKFLNLPGGTIFGYATAKNASPRFRDLPGYDAVLEAAERRARESKIQLTRKDLEFAGDVRAIPTPVKLSADLLIQFALSLAGDEDRPLPPRRARKK